MVCTVRWSSALHAGKEKFAYIEVWFEFTWTFANWHVYFCLVLFTFECLVITNSAKVTRESLVWLYHNSSHLSFISFIQLVEDHARFQKMALRQM
jgi:hypothetical protein